MQVVPVVAAVLFDDRGRVLITQRPAGKFMAGYWEFPGGKLQPGESAQSALKRELQEELGIAVQTARPLTQLSHDYPGMRVELDVWRVLDYQGIPHSAEGQGLAWVKPQELSNWKLLPADGPIVSAIRLPSLMLVTPSPGKDRDGFLQSLQQALKHGVEFVQLRAPSLKPSEYADLAHAVIGVCHFLGARVVVNAGPEVALAVGADGVHLNNARLLRNNTRPLPDELMVGASVHDENGIRRAVTSRLDYLVLGPVRPTPSHPQANPLGWDGFRTLASISPVPVYAIGDMSPGDVTMVRDHGGYGIAAVRALWELQESLSS